MKLHPPSPSLLLSPEADTHFTVPHRVEVVVVEDVVLREQYCVYCINNAMS